MAFVPLELRDLSGGVEEEQSTSFIEGGLKTLPGHPTYDQALIFLSQRNDGLVSDVHQIMHRSSKSN